MLIRTFNVLLLSLIAMLFFIVIQKPYEIDLKNYKLDFKSLEANDIIGFEVGEKLLKKAYAKHYYRINNENVFNDFKMLELDKNISSKVAIKNSDNIILKGNVVYKDKDIVLMSEEINYFITNKTLSSNLKTKVLYNKNTLNASSFSYDTTSGKLLLQEVDLCIEN